MNIMIFFLTTWHLLILLDNKDLLAKYCIAEHEWLLEYDFKSGSAIMLARFHCTSQYVRNTLLHEHQDFSSLAEELPVHFYNQAPDAAQMPACSYVTPLPCLPSTLTPI